MDWPCCGIDASSSSSEQGVLDAGLLLCPVANVRPQRGIEPTQVRRVPPSCPRHNPRPAQPKGLALADTLGEMSSERLEMKSRLSGWL